MERHSGGGGPPAHLRGRPVSGLEAAHANEYFEPFLNAATLKNILGYHRAMCDLLHLRPNVFPHFYPKLRANLTSWRAKALWKKFDARASHKCYGKGKACAGLRVLVIGAGPCGLRTAIEAQLLGAKVVVVEKRDRLSRNNVLHLWPFVIEDLRMLGAKKFFGKFCAGAIDHISIRQLQCILLKVALLLGVEIHTEVSFEGLIEPSAAEKTGWRGQFKPEQHPVSQYEFDVIIGADGKRNTLQGFKRKEFRGKLAIAITANFINKKTEAEARVEEISGVAFIFNQKFFKELQEKTRIDLENIVYYKDDTHYFVMTAKKASLLEKGVIKQDLADTEKLLALANVDQERLHSYAREAADFSTNYKLPHLEFAVNHYGTPDVAMFDFTSMYAADYASKVVERNGTRLLMILVGDSLLEPFWPTGSGCARGFLSSLDAAWAIRSYCSGQMTPLDVLAERESIYRLLAQTTPDNLNKDWKAYTLDPATRYPNLNKRVVTPHQTVFLYDTDNPEGIDRMKRASLDYMGRPEHVAKKRRRGNVDSEVLLSWLSEQLKTNEEIEISDVKSVFENGRVLCALIHHYRPDLLDYGAIKEWEASRCNQLAMDVLEKELGLSPFMTGEEITRTNDYLVMTAYLTQVYDTFRGEIPHIKHPKLKKKAVLSKIPQKFSEKSPKSGCKDDSYPLTNKTGEKVVKKRPKVPKIAINPPLQTLSERTVLPRNVGSLKSVKKREFFDLTYNAEVPREHKPKKVSSRNVCLSVNLLEKKPPKPKKKLIKKAKLAAIPEKTEEKCPQNPELTPKKTLNVFHCHTFITTKDSFESLGFPDVPVRIPYQDTQNPLEIPSKTPLENKNSTSKPQLGLKRFSPLELIRKHLRIKKARIEEVLNKTEAPPAEPEVIEKTSSVCSSQETINIEIIHAGNDDITRQNVFYESSKRLVKITSRNFVSKETMTRKDGSFVVQKIFENGNFQNFSGSKGASSNGRLEPRRFPGFKRKPLVESTPHLNKHQTAVKPSRHCQTCQIRENFQENNNRVYEGHSGDMPGNDGDKIAKRSKTMTFRETDGDIFSPQVYGRVQNWIRRHDFQEGDHEPNFDEPTALASCKTRSTEYDGVKVEQRTEVIKCMEENSSHEDLRDLVKPAKRASKLKIPKQRSRGSNVPKPVSKYSQFNLKSQSAPPVEFAVIMEGNEPELPENVTKPSEFSIKSIKTHQPPLFPITTGPPSRPSSRHKRHADLIQTKPGSLDRKQRKKRATLERTGPSVEERQKVLEEIACNRQDRQSRRKQQRQRQTEQFLKSMQMLQANCRPDDESSGPFEDYSIFLYRQTAPKFQDRVKDLEKQFTYVPDHESKLPGGPKPLTNTNAEEDIASKIKSLQDKWSNKHPTEKKPKDLMRAIGKIETSDWNIQQIEKKIIENKIGKPSTLNADKERVPRWSKEEFLARQTKMEKKHLDRQDSTEAKYADIDRNIKQLDLKLKEGMNRELGQNKVATITEKLVSKVPQEKEKPVEKPVPAKPVNIQSGSEFCHFCNKRVYLMERLSAEGRFFHHGCFKCQYCHSQLRLGSYMFDRDGQYGYRFFCIHHYGMQGELPRPTKLTRKPSQKGREVGQSPQKKPFGVTGVDLLDRVQTPERIEVSNLSSGNVSSDHEDHPSQMDEDEWTDKNFGQSCNELDESDDDDDSTSSVSDTDSDDEAAFDDALEQPVTKEGTMKWAERWKNSYRKGRGSDSDGYSSSDHSSYCENSSDESDSDTATEGEDEIRARELRKQEVRVDPPVVQTDTGTDTEVKKLSVDILPANLIISTPDILRLPLNKTPSGISLTTSDDVFNSAESDLDLNMNKTVASLPPVNPLSKSATAGNLIGAKPKRNFVLPPREQRKSFGQEFTPKYKLEEPLLVIKRTPSKVSMPKEIKPKVAVNTKKPIDTKKYFGAPRAPLKKAPLVKQSSLPETEKEILATVKPPINFEVKDSDFEDIDDYLEDLLKKEEELENPPPPEPEPDPSGSIEDLFSALEQETKPLEREQVKESEEKLQDLLKWMEELDHQEKTPEITRKNDNIAFFETIMGPHRGLSRSKTEIRFNRPTRQPRTSVDLDAVKKVNIKSVLKKFESLDREDGPAKPAPERPLVKRFSLGSFNVDQARENLKKLPLVRPKPIANTIKKFEASKAVKKATKSGIEDPLEDLEKFVDETIGNIGKGARLGRSGSDWCVNVTVSSKVSPEFLRMQLESARENVPEPARVNNEPVEVGCASVDALETSISLDVEASNPCQKNPEREDVSERIKEEQNLPLEIPTLGNIEAQRSPEEREIKGDSKEQVSEAPDPEESSEFEASNVQQISEKGLKDAPVISLDFSEELRQFDEAISALTDTSGSSDLLPPHNFSKAVQSSSSSSSLSSEYKKESNMPQDFAKAINSDSKEEEEEVKLPPQVPKRKKHLQPVCPRRHRSSTASPQPPRRRPEARRGSASDVEPPKAAQTGLKFPAKFGRKDKDKDCVIQ